jgi:hypothetical protein
VAGWSIGSGFAVGSTSVWLDPLTSALPITDAVTKPVTEAVTKAHRRRHDQARHRSGGQARQVQARRRRQWFSWCQRREPGTLGRTGSGRDWVLAGPVVH